MRRTIISIFSALTLISAVHSQEVTVTAFPDTSRIYLGDQINYTIAVEQPVGIFLSLKPLKDTLCKNIEILSGPVTDTILLSGNRMRLESRYLITSFDSGFYQIPPAYAEITDESSVRRFHSDYSFLEVIRVKIAPADTTDKIFDIVGPYSAPVTFGEILPWLLLAAASAALIWGIIFLWRKFRKSPKASEKQEIVEPAHVIAFRELEKLRDKQLWQKGEVKIYYSHLTEIIRQYLENRFGVFSMEMTTSETLEALLRTGFRKDQNYAILKSILNGADLVKFAKYKPEPVENDQHFQDSWQFVENTRTREETASAENVKSEKEKRT